MLISEIWRYPIKSMGGESLTEARVTDYGIEFDRGWGVYHPATSTVLTGRREPRLLMAQATVRGTRLSIRTVDDAIIDGEFDAETDRLEMSDALSTWLGYAVELRRAGSSSGTYEAPLDTETEQDWVAWTGPAEVWHDSARTRLSILSTASTAGIDRRRFRANLIVDADDIDDWVGEDIQIGSAGAGVELSVCERIERCVMVARAQQGLEPDLDALRWVIRERDNRMGIGATVTQPGTIALGDEILRLSTD